MNSFRLLQVSDLHLGAADRRHLDNWEIVLEWIENEKPDLVVVTGDIILHDCDSLEDLDFAKRQLARIGAPWKVLPDNHDIGDNVMSGGGKRVNADRLQRWTDHFGEDRWIVRAGGWAFIGLNSQVLNSNGLKTEEEQAIWLNDTLTALPSDCPIALFLHKPMFMDYPAETVASPDCLDPVARSIVSDAFRGRALKMIACGHKHQYRSFALNGVYHMWAPSVSTINKAPDVKMWGLREVGFVEYHFDGDRIRQRLLGRDFLFRHESYICKLDEAEDQSRGEWA